MLAPAGDMNSDNGNTARPTRLVPLAVLRLATDLRYELAVADRRVESVRSRIVPDASLNRNFTDLADALDSAFLIARELIAFARRIGQIEDVDLNALVHESRGVIERMLGEGVRLKITVHPDLPLVSGDAMQIEWMLLGSVLNARDAMGGRGTLTVETTVVDPDAAELYGKGREGGWIRLTISDTGPTSRHPQDGAVPLLPPHPEAGDVSLATVAFVARRLGGWLNSEPLVPAGTAVHLYLPVSGQRFPRRLRTPAGPRA